MFGGFLVYFTFVVSWLVEGACLIGVSFPPSTYELQSENGAK